MKKSITLFAFALALIITSCENPTTVKETSASTAFDTTKLKTGEAFYQCEMHPEVTSDKPGTCPKCGMDLVKLEKK